MRTIRSSLLALSLVAGVSAAGVAFAEDLDVGGLIDSAKAAYGGKHYGKALADLNLAVGEVARLRMEILKGLVPAAPSGWKAEETEGSTGLGLGMMPAATSLKRRYTKGDDVNVEAELWADAAAMFAPYQMLLQFTPPGAQVVMVKGRKAILELAKGQTSGTLTVILGSANTVLKLSGNGVTKADLVDTIGGAFDLDAIEKAVSD